MMKTLSAGLPNYDDGLCALIGYYVLVRSRVPVPIHVHESEVESNLSPDLIEAPVGLVVILNDISVSSVAEGRIGRILAVAELVVPALTDVEGDRSAPSYGCVTGAVTAGVAQTQSA